MKFLSVITISAALIATSFAMDQPSSHTKGAPTGKPTGALNPGEYWWKPQLSPRGPVVALVSLPQQTMYVYRNGILIGRSSVSSGRKGNSTLAHFEGRRCVLSFEDPLARETVAFNGHTVPLAADFTVPLAVMLQESDPKKHELSRLLNPEKYAHTAAIERLQPYDPAKAVVLVIHGLRDSQATWALMINKLRGDPMIRKHYQFWFYSYPTGYPFPYSAAILHGELDAVEKRFPEMKPMVVIGHSMGGCISRLLLTDSGNKLWMNIFGRPPDEVPLSPRVREYFRDELFFQHRPEIGRVIFIASRCAAATWPED